MISLTRRIDKRKYNVLGHIIPAKDVITATVGIIAGYIIILGVFYLIVFIGR